MARPDCHAVHQQLAELADNAGRVVFRPSRGAGIHHDDVVLFERTDNTVAEQRSLISRDRQPSWLTTPFAHLTGKHDRVEVDDGTGRHRGAGFNKLGPRREDGDARAPPHADACVTGRDNGSEIDRAEGVVLRQHELCGHQVFTHRADVLPRRDGIAGIDPRRLGAHM